MPSAKLPITELIRGGGEPMQTVTVVIVVGLPSISAARRCGAGFAIAAKQKMSGRDRCVTNRLND
jgi:hypothetical protein